MMRRRTPPQLHKRSRREWAPAIAGAFDCPDTARSTPTRVKTVLQTLIDDIQVNPRDNIESTFRIPARLPGGRMSLDDAA